MDTAISNWLPRLQPLTYDEPKFNCALRIARRSEFWGEAARADQLSEIASLQDDWDGSGAIAVSDEAIEHARAILNSLTTTGSSPDLILPGSAGTVLFEWELPLGTSHLEIGRSTFGFYTSPTVGEPIMYGGQIEELYASNIRDAIATISPNSTQSSMAFGNNSMGI